MRGYNLDQNIELNQIKEIVDICLKTLLEKDKDLIDNDVSERSITHKFAEYLQHHFKILTDISMEF